MGSRPKSALAAAMLIAPEQRHESAQKEEGVSSGTVQSETPSTGTPYSKKPYPEPATHRGSRPRSSLEKSTNLVHRQTRHDPPPLLGDTLDEPVRDAKQSPSSTEQPTPKTRSASQTPKGHM